MSIVIVTVEQSKILAERAKRYGEVAEALIGKARQDYVCDHTNEDIPAGTECAAVVLLPDNKHPNYQHQIEMRKEYIDES